MRHDFLERFQRGARRQRGQVQARQRPYALTSIDLIELQVFDCLIVRSGSMHEPHRMLIRIDLVQDSLDFRGNQLRVDLSDQGRHIRGKCRDVPAAKRQRVPERQTWVWVDTERGERGLEEREAVDNPQRESLQRGKPGDFWSRGLRHERVSGHAVNDALRAPAHLKNAPGDLRVDLIERGAVLVDVVK